MKKSDVEISYHLDHRSRGCPMINVKNYLWLPDLIRKYRTEGHEFSGDEPFWEWVEETYENDDSRNYPSVFDQADEIAREVCWGGAQSYADVTFRRNVKVWSAGRSGGWLVVEGLPDVEEWDAIALGRWAKFNKLIRGLADEEYPYQFIWHLHVNVYEPQVLEPARADAMRAEAAERTVDRLARLIGAS